MFNVVEKYYQLLFKENLKAAPDRSLFSHPYKIPWTYYRRKYDHSIKIPHRRNYKASTSIKQKENPRVCWNAQFLNF